MHTMSDFSPDFSSNKGIGLLLTNSNIVAQQKKESSFSGVRMDSSSRQFSNMLDQNRRELDKPKDAGKSESQVSEKPKQQNVGDSKNISENRSSATENTSRAVNESADQVNDTSQSTSSKKAESDAANHRSEDNAQEERVSPEDEEVVESADGSVEERVAEELGEETLNEEEPLLTEELLAILNVAEETLIEEGLAVAKQIIQEDDVKSPVNSYTSVVKEERVSKVSPEITTALIEDSPAFVSGKVTEQVLESDSKKGRPVDPRFNPVAQALSREDGKKALAESNKHIVADLVLANKVDLELPVETVAENPFEEVLKKMGENKSKLELMLANNAIERDRSVNGNKQRTSSELVEQLTAKLSSNITPLADRGSALPSLGGLRASINPQVTQGVLNTPMSSPDWSNAFSKRIHMLVRNEVQLAELRLDPPDLGRVNIRISISQDQASLAFSSQHANVRDAIDATMPKLREMLEESGLSLANVDVSPQFSQQQGSDSEQNLNGSSFSGLAENGEENEQVIRRVLSDSLIDFFA